MNTRTANRFSSRLMRGGEGVQRPVPCEDCGANAYPRDMVHVPGSFPARWRCVTCPPACAGSGRHTMGDPWCTSCRAEGNG